MTPTTIAPTSELPPTPDQLLAALDVLTVPDDGLALLHLASPLDAAIPVTARRERGVWQLRDQRRAVTGDDLGDVLALVWRAHRAGDRYFDLTTLTGPARYVKIQRSGARKVAFGSDVLLGGPHLLADTDVPDVVLASALHSWQDDPNLHRGGVVTVDGHTYLVEGDHTFMLFRSLGR